MMIDVYRYHKLLCLHFALGDTGEVDRHGYPKASSYAREYLAGWRETRQNEFSDVDLSCCERVLQSMAGTDHYRQILAYYKHSTIRRRPEGAIKNFAILMPDDRILSTIQRGR